jgi:hypothetical protein
MFCSVLTALRLAGCDEFITIDENLRAASWPAATVKEFMFNA